MEFKRLASISRAAAFSLAIAIIGCSTPGPLRPEGRIIPISASESRFDFPVSTLASPGRFNLYASDNGEYLEETAQWTGNSFKDGEAGLLLSEAKAGPPLADPADPAASFDLWPLLRGKTPAFGEVRQTENTLGNADWQRAAIGTAACVLFVQRWAGNASITDGNPYATLSGYYCNPPGETLSAEAAERVVKALDLRGGPKRQ